jgi:dCMP deaminase
MNSKEEKRDTWDMYFMQMARYAASRATCDRKHVGCVLVKDKRIISTGYNGSMPGQPHCDDVGHELNSDGGCIRTSHAEASAITQAARFGIGTSDSIVYCTMMPCYTCAKLLVMAGVKEVVYLEDYRITRSVALFSDSGVKMRQIESVDH